MLKNLVKKFISNQSFLLRTYHHLRSWFWSLCFGFPTRSMYVIAVTGTNGKTSMCNLLYQAYSKMGLGVSMLSTVNYAVGSVVYDNLNKMSTLPPFKLNKLLYQMRRAKTNILIIEATSHAAVQGRLNGIAFDQLIFTNIGSDHLEYHGSFENYLQAKTSLVRKIKQTGVFIYNAQDRNASEFVKVARVPVVSYGPDATDTVCVSDYTLSLRGSRVTIKIKDQILQIDMNLLGFFNVLNLSAVILSLLQYDSECDVAMCVQDLKPVSGRLDVLFSDDNVFVFDYAHDPESLERLLSFVAQYKTANLRVLFGCTGGGRDKSKRPKMGAVAEKYADVIYLTNDDPYSEDPVQIIDDIKSGMSDGSCVQAIVAREKAIEKAMRDMSDGDVLVLAGKGGEKVTVINDQIIPFDEKEIVLDLIQKN